MAKALILLLVALATSLAAVPQILSDNRDLGRIIGGSDAPDGQYPYQVSLRTNGGHYCGGSIISSEWILTVGSCIVLYPNITVYAGSNQRTSGGTIYKVLETIYHEDLLRATNRNDVGLIRVEPITFTDKVQPISLDIEEILGEETCTLTGWGVINRTDEEWPENLQHISLKTITLERCKESYGERLFHGHICTLTKPYEGFCSGDRGGPLVREVNGNYKQIGIASWGDYCVAGYADVYTRISSYIPWIRKNCRNCIYSTCPYY